MMVDGAAAQALGDLARERWRRATGEALPQKTIDACLTSDSVLLGAVMGTAYMPSGGLVSAIQHLVARPQPPATKGQ